ncbi:hypothetical protein PP459_gp176 [Streptomyces phage Wakanda]|uniref:Uncharacterized protein n=2 Tax=Wakandavirus TaxID=3044854 RepID=A0A6G8R357_9CAUD|nr:hypothetical protein PP459_gp176 [Streptomyces phage Wakanda]YP_010652377.1 hypothetical protein PP460_gp181 [Streptomyces phage Muntaha]QIN94057.1 hypothetical protein SEA_WAKANDA_65 [Streptomyces phage Wakanda]QIN94622.1 hypothetical protein SEA_MUNTAHA_66 [Streptomyces phage Muntaha]
MKSEKGCCSTCEGTGVSGDIETNGKCWDCYGTGHTHSLSAGIITTKSLCGGFKKPTQKGFK